MNIRKCDLCPRKCGVNREKGETGRCGGGNNVKIAWYGKHFGEEPVISGTAGPASAKASARQGSGTIFFCHCNLKCVFCQNWQISWGGGSEADEGCKGYEGGEVVRIMMELQQQGAGNINLVSPTVWSYWLKDILIEAKKEGLTIPIIWNSNGYEEVGVLRELKGLIDIYLPDYKYDDEELAIKYSSALNYPVVARKAILEMQRQAGDLVLDNNRLAKKGLIVRHLILPGQMKNTIKCLKFIRSISPDIHLSLMSQYNPLYKAKDFPEINRTLTKEEYERVLRDVGDLGFSNGWIQEFGKAVKCFSPDFRKEKPFNH